jgi:hypothetical protein
MATTAYTTDGVKVIADNGRIGDRHYDFTRVVLSAEAEALVMSWVPYVAAVRLPELIRRAGKGKLNAYVSPDQAADAMAQNSRRRCDAINVALTYNRNPRTWGF